MKGTLRIEKNPLVKRTLQLASCHDLLWINIDVINVLVNNIQYCQNAKKKKSPSFSSVWYYFEGKVRLKPFSRHI